MKKIIAILSLVVLITTSTFAQSMYGDAVKFDVKMKYIYSFEEALKTAKKENKLIFFNCFADWAGPCHAMNKHVFSDQAFADWMDKNFVNFFMDVTSKAGNAFANKYAVRTMAHYLVLDQNGEIVHRIVGGHQIPEFKAILEKSLNPKTSLVGMDKRYAAGERTIPFMRDYFETLRHADQNDKSNVVLDEILAKLKPAEYSKKENWRLITAKIRSSKDPLLAHVIDNKAAYVKASGDSTVNDLISKIYFKELYPYASGDSLYSGEVFLNSYLAIQKGNLPAEDKVFTIYDIGKFRGEGKYKEMLTAIRTRTEGWNKSMLTNLELSLGKFKSVSIEDKKILEDYLLEKSSQLSEKDAKSYKSAINKLNNVDGIQFENINLAEALKKAKAENKMVFMDCYTTWCGPCKWLDENTFRDKQVGDFFKRNFVSIKVDMERGEGPAILKKYEVKAFPTLLVLRADGTIAKRMLGAMDAQSLLKQIGELN